MIIDETTAAMAWLRICLATIQYGMNERLYMMNTCGIPNTYTLARGISLSV